MQYVDKSGLAYFWTKIKSKLNAITAQLPSTISGYDISGKSGSMELWSQNLNNVTTSGFYNAITCTNAPYQYSTLIVVGYYLEGYCTQIITDVTSGNMKKRSQINWSWTAWTDV